MKLAINGGKPVRKKLLVFGSPQILKPEIREVVDSLKSGWIGSGPKVKKFEEQFRKYIGSKYALATNSCTAALHLSLLAAGIGKGDEVITTPMTFAATANVILHVGATPVFADIDKETQNIDPKEIEGKITEKTKAILPVHLHGRPCDMAEICRIALDNKLRIISDAAHCIEGTYKGKKIGSIWDLAAFSFYVTKNVCCCEGGMITTNNKVLAEKIRTYTMHGLSKGAWERYKDKGFKHYEVILPGYKYNMTDLQAALGIHQLKRIEKNWRKRRKIWTRYCIAFEDLPAQTPTKWAGKHARHLYTLLLDLDELKADRNKVQQALYKEGIGTGIHYKSLHLHKYYSERFAFEPEDFPNAKFVSDRTISLPLGPGLTEKDVGDVIKAVTKVLEFYRR